MARKLSHDFKLSARTAPELYEAFNHLVLRVAATGRKFRGRKIGAEAILNALLIDLFDRPEPERLAMLARNVARFEAILDREEPADLDALGGDPPPHHPGRSVAAPKRGGKRTG